MFVPFCRLVFRPSKSRLGNRPKRGKWRWPPPSSSATLLMKTSMVWVLCSPRTMQPTCTFYASLSPPIFHALCSLMKTSKYTRLVGESKVYSTSTCTFRMLGCNVYSCNSPLETNWRQALQTNTKPEAQITSSCKHATCIWRLPLWLLVRVHVGAIVPEKTKHGVDIQCQLAGGLSNL